MNPLLLLLTECVYILTIYKSAQVSIYSSRCKLRTHRAHHPQIVCCSALRGTVPVMSGLYSLFLD